MRASLSRPIALLLLIWPLLAAVTAGTGLPSATLAASGGWADVRAHRAHPLPVWVDVRVGYSDMYRSSAWVPIRVTLRNRTSNLIDGTASVNDTAPSNGYRTLYQAHVVLPAGATKLVTLFLPGEDVNQNQNVEVTVQSSGATVGKGSGFGTDLGAMNLIAGALASDPATTQWLTTSLNAIPRVLPLTPATLDPYPQALSTFDLIVLTNADTSRLNADQLAALHQYVEAGGGIILVGGPDWQETLKPLPAWLVPGRLAGTRTLSDLRGLLAVRQAGAAGPLDGTRGSSSGGGPTTVSVLANPRGAVLASEAGVPLAVVANEGEGRIVYLAFDPNVAPIPQWSEGHTLVSDLFTMAAPEAISRVASQSGNQGGFVGGPINSPLIGEELANVPAAALPSLILFIVLAIGYVLLLGPANFLVLRRFGRRELAWVTVPVLALLCFCTTFLVAFQLKGDTVLLNSIGIVRLDGSDAQRPATIYTGLFAPVRGDYTLTYNGPALGTSISNESDFYSYGGPFPGPYRPTAASRPSLSIQQGTQTDVTLPSMNMWSMRDVELQTTADVPGSIGSNLHVDGRGDIVGTIHNGTNLDVARPLVLAGYSVTRLPDLPASATLRVKIRPDGNLFPPRPLWLKAYAPQSLQGAYFSYGMAWKLGIYGARRVFIGGPCCGPSGPSLPSESTLDDRIRTAATVMPEAAAIEASGEVVLAGWTQHPLGSMSVDGATPQRRDLSLVYTPLSVRLAPGQFTLRMGTIGAHLLTINAAMAGFNGCCAFYRQPITIGPGGWGLFRFEIPHQGRLHFRTLTLWANLGGPSGTDNCQLFDHLAGKWVTVDVSSGSARVANPDRFLSPDGSLMLKVRATVNSASFSGNGYSPSTVVVQDPFQDLQISGSGSVA